MNELTSRASLLFKVNWDGIERINFLDMVEVSFLGKTFWVYAEDLKKAEDDIDKLKAVLRFYNDQFNSSVKLEDLISVPSETPLAGAYMILKSGEKVTVDEWFRHSYPQPDRLSKSFIEDKKEQYTVAFVSDNYHRLKEKLSAIKEEVSDLSLVMSGMEDELDEKTRNLYKSVKKSLTEDYLEDIEEYLQIVKEGKYKKEE